MASAPYSSSTEMFHGRFGGGPVQASVGCVGGLLARALDCASPAEDAGDDRLELSDEGAAVALSGPLHAVAPINAMPATAIRHERNPPRK